MMAVPGRQTDGQTHFSTYVYTCIRGGGGERRQKQYSAVPLLTRGSPSETSTSSVMPDWAMLV